MKIAAAVEDSSCGIITRFTERDVLNGRGQGVQRHAGNVKYRTLVFVNKGLYAKCPRNDKIKISKGIVAAVREVGGRFLDMDERAGTYTDIGDKKATEKTSQALREGQTKIRQDIYQQEDTSMIPIPEQWNADGPNKEMSSETYFKYSVVVLKSLYEAEANLSPEMAARPAPHSVATQLGLQQNQPQQPPQPPQPPQLPPLPPPQVFSTASSAHMAAVLDQFDGMVPVQHQQQHGHQQKAPSDSSPGGRKVDFMPSPDHQRSPDKGGNLSSSPFADRTSMRDTILSRFTGLSLLSNFSNRNISELIMETAGVDVDPDLMELMRQSVPELMCIQSASAEEFDGRESSFDLRFTDLSKERFSDAARSSDSTTSSQLMQRDTMLTIPAEEYSHGMFPNHQEYSPFAGSVGLQHQVMSSVPAGTRVVSEDVAFAQKTSSRMSEMSVDEDAIAEVLLRLSRDSIREGGDAMQM